jgi:curved DNA-binding protein CbpA
MQHALPPPAADALFRAARDHATGWLTLSAAGAEARLYLQTGDVVGARLGFGYQTVAQALLGAGLVDLPTLDALWARGEAGAASEALLAASGLDASRVTELQTLASVRRLVTLSSEASFMPALVDVALPRLPGARVVRSAFELLGPLPVDAIVCCRDVEACAGWLLREDERAFLLRFETFRPVGDLHPEQAALLRLLQHDGRVEILDAAGFQARVTAEREAEVRRAEEEVRREAARAAIESARLAEEARRSGQRERAEQARRALEAAQAAEAAWREAQAQVPRRETPVEEALADTLVRRHALEATDVVAVPLSLESTDPAFPQPGFGESAEVPRLTAAETLDAGELPQPDSLRPLIVATGRHDTFKTFPAADAGEPPAPRRLDTEEPLIIPAAAPPPGVTPKRRDTLKPFVAPDTTPTLTDEPQLPWEPDHPPRSTPVWGAERDDRAAADTLLRSAERVEVLPVPGAFEQEPILLIPETEVPPPGQSPSALVDEMTEALRRSGAETSAATWLAATDGVVSAGQPSSPRPAAPPASDSPRPPLHLGPATAGSEEDLWRLVAPPVAPAPAAAASFEEALANVDAHLSSLVGLAPVPGPGAQPAEVPVDAILQASDDAGAWRLESLPESPPTPAALSPLEATPALTPSGGSGDASRERRQRLLRRAIQNLGSLVSRRTMSNATPLEPTPAPVTAPLPRRAAEQALALQIEQRFAALSGARNRFETLGLPVEASRDEVKRSFLELVKVFHPDRLPPSLGSLLSKATAIFDSLREANDYLQDDGRRAAHAREVVAVASGRPLPDQAEAAEAFKAGEAALRRRDQATAEAQFAESYRLYPRAQTLAARAWAIYMDPARKSDAAAARAMMVDALKEDPSCDRAHYQLGVIARVEGDVERAERHFREALKANPRHLEASQELRLIEMRKRGGPARKPR